MAMLPAGGVRMAAEKKPASRKSPPRRKPYRMAYDKTRVARVAYLAGKGCSAAEIAAEISGIRPAIVERS